MKQLNTFIKENTEYKEYTCYFGNFSTGSPKDLFLSAFVEEYIFKLYYEKLTGSKVVKTNETNQSVRDNWSHIDIKTPNSNIDVKTISRRWNSITINNDIKGDINIGTIIENEGKVYIVVNKLKDIKGKGRNKGQYSVYTIPILMDNAIYKEELYSDLTKKYKELLKLYTTIPDYNDEGLEDYSKVVLKYLTPVFEKEFGLTPKIEFV